MCPPRDDLPKVLTLREAAEFVRVSEKTLSEMARRGEAPGKKVGREWRFLATALESWLAGSDEGGAPEGSAREGSETRDKAGFGDAAFTQNRDESVHRWVPWLAGFSAGFVRSSIERVCGGPDERLTIFDPFAGVGTTLVEGLRRGHEVVGFEINPYAALVCKVKVEAGEYDLAKLRRAARAFRKFMQAKVADADAEPQSRPPAGFRSRAPFFHPSIERQVLFAKDFLVTRNADWARDLVAVALGATLVSYSNYSYEPSLCRRATAGKQDIAEADVTAAILDKLSDMTEDIGLLQEELAQFPAVPEPRVYCESCLTGASRVAPRSVDLVITSPPYLNNYHYVRNTRPHLYWLDLVAAPEDLKGMEHASFGKFWQTVRAGPRLELAFDYPELVELISTVRALHEEKGVYGGSGWANYAVSYFNDCQAFCRATLGLMKPGGIAVVVIGNNILQGIEIKTDEFFAGIAQRCGFELLGIHRVRTKRTGSSIINSSVRAAKTTGRPELYESAVELRAP